MIVRRHHLQQHTTHLGRHDHHRDAARPAAAPRHRGSPPGGHRIRTGCRFQRAGPRGESAASTCPTPPSRRLPSGETRTFTRASCHPAMSATSTKPGGCSWSAATRDDRVAEERLPIDVSKTLTAHEDCWRRHRHRRGTPNSSTSVWPHSWFLKDGAPATPVY